VNSRRVPYNVERFVAERGIPLTELRHYAIAENEAFWDDVARNLGPPWLRKYDAVKNERSPADVEWFPGGETNLAACCWREDLPADGVALCWICESGQARELSRAELRACAAGLSADLSALGLRPGDRVAVIGAGHWSVACAILGVLSLGAICIPLFSGYGRPALRDRLMLGRPDLVIVQDVTIRGGEPVPLASRVLPLVDELAIPAAVLMTGQEGSADIHGACSLWPVEHLAAGPDRTAGQDPTTAARRSSDTAFVLFTSGSTGRPKQVHLSHGGLAVQAAAEWQLHLDLRQGDRVLWPADLGWLVGPWSLVGVLGGGGCLTLVEGIPAEALVRHRDVVRTASILGGSPTFLSWLAADPGFAADPHPRIIATAGEPIAAQTWRRVRSTLGQGTAPVINLCGGTEVASSLLAGLPTDDTAPGGFGGGALGADVDAVGSDGIPVRDIPANLVCRNAWPGRATAVIGEGRSLDSYFSRFGCWEQGDLALRTGGGEWYVLGRSDEVMKIRGRRLGPAEVEETALQIEGVHACVSAAIKVAGQSSLVCVLLCDEEVVCTAPREGLHAIESSLGRAFRPIWVGGVTEMPRTSSGKIDRRQIRAVIEEAAGLAADAPAAATALSLVFEARADEWSRGG
jgi:acetyl-CoA synthetase